MKTPKTALEKKSRRRNFVRLDMARLLLTIGAQNPPFKAKHFIQRIRLHQDSKMSYEYKILKKLCPVYGEIRDPTINKVFPYQRHCNNKDKKYLWTEALVKLDLDEETVRTYYKTEQRYYNARHDYNSAISERLSEQEVKEKEEGYDLARKNYSSIVDTINSRHHKELFVALTFRGLLTFLYYVYEYQADHIERKKGKRDLEEREKNKERKRKKGLVKGLREKIHKVIRNPYVIKDIPFLVDSELHSGLGFDVVGTLLDISVELIGQLHIDANEDQYLLVRATERYLAEFDSFFFDSHYDSTQNSFSFNIAFIQPIKGQERTDEQEAAEVAMVIRLNKYRRNMAKIMRMRKLDELREIDTLLYQSSVMDSSFKQEHSDSDSGIEGGAAMIFSIPRKDED